MPVRVKICGLTRPEDVEAVNEARSDYAGFVFYEMSKRYVGFEKAGDLLGRLDPGIRSVAVCVSPDADLLGRLEGLGFDVIQIHGEIDAGLLDGIETSVWQAVNLSETDSSKVREQLKALVDHPRICGYLIDAAEYGSGKTFGWENAGEIRQAAGDRTFILAGGLNPGNVREAIRLFSPDVVDVSSGVEPDDGSAGKDREKIFRFIDEVRQE